MKASKEFMERKMPKLQNRVCPICGNRFEAKRAIHGSFKRNTSRRKESGVTCSPKCSKIYARVYMKIYKQVMSRIKNRYGKNNNFR